MKPGIWQNRIEKANDVRRTNQCPYAAFMEKHGANPKYDLLVFPRDTDEFQERENRIIGTSYEGWPSVHKRNLRLPRYATVDHIWKGWKKYKDRVAIRKFPGVKDLIILKWELVVNPWSEGSHSIFSYEIANMGTRIIEKTDQH